MILVSFFLEDNVPGASIHFSDWGGGGGARVRKMSNFSARAERAAKLEIVYDCLVVF